MKLPDDVLKTLWEAPWESEEILDAVEKAFDLGMANLAEREMDNREQMEQARHG